VGQVRRLKADGDVVEEAVADDGAKGRAKG